MSAYLFRPSFACGLALVLGCSTRLPPTTSQTQSTVATPESEFVRRAAAARDDGILDVAAEELRREYAARPSPQAKAALIDALEAAWAFGAAAALKQERAPVPGALPPDPELVGRLLHALTTRDAIAVRRELLSPFPPGTSPLVLELVGRGHLLLGESVLARQAFARARTLIDEMGGHLGVVPSTAGYVTRADVDDGRVILARARERLLVGGYDNSLGHSMWVESYVPGDADPLLRWPVGNIDGFDVAKDGKTFAIIDRPLVTDHFSRQPSTVRLVDLRTGIEKSRWDADGGRDVAFGRDGSLFELRGASIDFWNPLGEPGKLARSLTITGTTPGVMRVYGRTKGRLHDNIPVTYASSAVAVDVSTDGTVAVGASDGAVWIWPSGGARSFALLPLRSRSAPEDPESRIRRPLIVRLDDDARGLVVVAGDGGVTRWDLKTRRGNEAVPRLCTEGELNDRGFNERPTAVALAECAFAPDAHLSPDGLRLILSSQNAHPRLRDLKGAPPLTGNLDTLDSGVVAWVDATGTTAWLGGVFGTVRRWDTSSRTGLEWLAQGGAEGRVRDISRDGRYIAVAGSTWQSPGADRVWDTSTHASVTTLPTLTEETFVGRGRVAGHSKYGFFLWDVATGARIGQLRPGEWIAGASEDGQRLVSWSAGKLLVRSVGESSASVLREIESGDAELGVGVDGQGRTAWTASKGRGVSVWDLDDGHRRLNIPNGIAASLAVDGQSLAWWQDKSTVVVSRVDDRREVARVTGADLGQSHDYEPGIAACLVVGDSDALLVGEDGHVQTRVFRWHFGQPPIQTDVQLLGVTRMVPWSDGVVAVFDIHNAAHLLRVKDGTLLATISSTLDGGWAAISRQGAVDASADGRSAFLTNVSGTDPVGGSSWLGWDRFAVTDLVSRAARGEVVPPPIAADVLKTGTLAAKDGHAAVPAGR